MEVDPANHVEQRIKPEDHLKAAETGDASTFQSLPPGQLSDALTLRNDDARSLLHVAVSSSHPKVVKILSEAEGTSSVLNSKDEEGWALLHSTASIGNAEIVEILLSKGWLHPIASSS